MADVDDVIGRDRGPRPGEIEHRKFALTRLHDLQEIKHGLFGMRPHGDVVGPLLGRKCLGKLLILEHGNCLVVAHLGGRYGHTFEEINPAFLLVELAVLLADNDPRRLIEHKGAFAGNGGRWVAGFIWHDRAFLEHRGACRLSRRRQARGKWCFILAQARRVFQASFRLAST